MIEKLMGNSENTSSFQDISGVYRLKSHKAQSDNSYPRRSEKPRSGFMLLRGHSGPPSR